MPEDVKECEEKVVVIAGDFICSQEGGGGKKSHN